MDNNELYTNNLVKILNKYSLNLDIFKNKKSEMFIGGSSIIQSILSEEWNDSDIDIYINISDFPSISNMLYNNNYNLNSATDNYASMQIFKFGKYHESLLNNGKPLVLKIDVVVVKGPYEDFFNKFDLDVCKSRFNGKNFFVENEENIIKKVANYQFHNVWNEVKETDSSKNLVAKRMEKYQKRGFTINNF